MFYLVCKQNLWFDYRHFFLHRSIKTYSTKYNIFECIAFDIKTNRCNLVQGIII